MPIEQAKTDEGQNPDQADIISRCSTAGGTPAAEYYGRRMKTGINAEKDEAGAAADRDSEKLHLALRGEQGIGLLAFRADRRGITPYIYCGRGGNLPAAWF